MAYNTKELIVIYLALPQATDLYLKKKQVVEMESD